QNNILLAAPDDLTSLNDVNLPYCVVKLNSRVKYDSLNNNIKDGDPSGKEGEDDTASEMDDDEEDKKEEEEEGDDMEDDEGEEDDIDMDLDKKQKKPQDSLLNGDEFEELDSSDFDEDNFDDIAPEGQEDDDDEDEENENEDDDSIGDDDNRKDDYDEEEDDDDDEEEINDMKKSLEKDKSKMDILKKPDKFKSTNVDDEFFNLRESEWVADNDILGEELEGNFDDIDFMEDLTDEEEDAGAAMYNTFFDSIDKKKNRNKKTNEENKPQIEHVNVKPGDKEIKDEDSKEESDDEDIEEGVTKLLGGNKKETKSSFEREQEKERRIIESLEEEQMSEKPWFLKGEVQNQDRPENSTLEEHLEYDIAAKQ
ncbi:unnamed protein product, partial [Meganyctiphanes norvegica]